MGIPVLLTDNSSDTTGLSSIAFGDSYLTSTYDEYMFVLTDINTDNDDIDFGFQVNVDGQTGYNEVITSSYFHATHRENDSGGAIGYEQDGDQAQGTANQILGIYLGNQADAAMAGVLHLFSPANTTYVKHFYARTNLNDGAAPSYQRDQFLAGYINVTGAIDEISFSHSSGNFDGLIQMYGIK